MDGLVADAVVVAAGSSRRMGGRDKLLADVGGRPLLAWTLASVAAAPSVRRIVVVRGAQDAGAPRPGWLPGKVIGVVAGGERRQESVLAGLQALEAAGRADGSSVVLVHDGARPLASPALVERVAAAAAQHGAAIPVLPIAETIKRVAGDRIVETVDRSGAVTAQTPQGVRWDVLREALGRIDPAGPAELTDEAGLLEAAGVAVRAVAGELDNRKVTTSDDLDRAIEQLLAPGIARAGLGIDGHAFGPGQGLRLGGIEIAGAPRLHGHSDGDAALHAVAGGLLGAAALGDLGELFPADARTPRGVASGDLVREVVARLAAAGWTPHAIDLTIRAGRPRLASHLPAMRSAIARLTGIDPDAVSVKAASGNLSGDVGAGRTIEAQAIVTVGRLAGSGDRR